MSSTVTNTLNVVEGYLKNAFPELSVIRTYRPVYVFGQMKTSDPVKVVVSPFDRMAYRQDRSKSLKSTLVVDVSVLKKLDAVNNETVDPLVDVVSDLFDELSQCVTLRCDDVLYRIEEVEHGDHREMCFEEFLFESMFLGAMQARISVDVT